MTRSVKGVLKSMHFSKKLIELLEYTPDEFLNESIEHGLVCYMTNKDFTARTINILTRLTDFCLDKKPSKKAPTVN
jgi:hypothetical protein